MSDSRWFVAIHEAGHAVAAIVLGGECHIAVVTDMGGECRIDGLRHTDSAFMTAAGPAAERLLASVPSPELPPPPVAKITDCEIPADGDTDTAPTLQLSDFYLTDDQRIASWAVNGYEADPERWLGRVLWCHSMAETIVRDHAEFIVAVATELYSRGSLTSADISQIQNRKEQAA